MHADVVSIHVLPRQLQKFVLVLPAEGVFFELLRLVRWQRWLSDLGDQIGSRCFGQTIYQNPNKGNLNENVETKSEAKKDTGTILEP